MDRMKLSKVILTSEDLGKADTNAVSEIVFDALAEKLGDEFNEFPSYAWSIEVEYEMEDGGGAII